jgi:FkbM family methyltransferase
MPFFLPNLKKSGHLASIDMTVCNVGSRKLTSADDYGGQGWQLFAPNLTIYGFDADEAACAAANTDFEARQADWHEFHIPLAICNKVGKAQLYVTKNPMCSSLYPPNEALLQRFPRLPALASLDYTVEIETTTLDAICQTEEIDEIDYLQIDVQGADLQVVEGATALLDRSVLAIQIEVEFSPLYSNQPLFAEVDTFLRGKGFVFFGFDLINPEPRSHLKSLLRPGQLLWSNALYLRDPLQAETANHFKTPDQIFKLACIADILELTDYALELLEFLTLQYGQDNRYNVANPIVESMARLPELMQLGLHQLPTINKLQDYITGTAIDLIQASQQNSGTIYAPPVEAFHGSHYLRHNQRRQEHLASLGLDLVGKTVLEVGAGIGDHTGFFLDRGCAVTITEGRPENLAVLTQRYPDQGVKLLDLNEPDPTWQTDFDIVYAYGLLYHLHNPETALQFMANHTHQLLLLETAVSPKTDQSINLRAEPIASATQSISGEGCRPTRQWIYHQLKKHFEFVYLPITQPHHPEFPLDWTTDLSDALYVRAVFIASRKALNNSQLIEGIPMQHHY